MADSDSGSEFSDLINQQIRDRTEGIGDDYQSDLSVSSVHTPELSDFDEFEDYEYEYDSFGWTVVGRRAAELVNSPVAHLTRLYSMISYVIMYIEE